MKANILKFTGLTEEQFYNKYKTKKAFFGSKVGKDFQAQFGANMGPQQQPQGYVNPNGYQGYPSIMNNYQVQNVQFPKPVANYNPNDIAPIPANPNYGKKQQQASAAYQDSSTYQTVGDYSAPDPGEKREINPMEAIPVIGGLAKAFSMHKQQKKQLQKERQSYAVLGVQEQASQLTPERLENKWITPWDNPTSSNTLNAAKGRGYTALTKNGGKVNKSKKAFGGFNMRGGGASSGTGWGGQMGFDNSQMMNGMSQTIENQSAGGAAGGAIGGAFGMGLPLALVGDALDKGPERIAAQQKANKERLNNILTNYAYKDLHQGQYQANVENGGNIKKARMGGHFKEAYQSPNESGMIPYENGGKTAFNGAMKVGNGYLKPLSYNPHLPGTGITYEFKGPSHDDGGMQTYYGEAGSTMAMMDNGGNADGTHLEAEGLETVSETSDGIGPDGQPKLSARIAGNMEVSARNAKLLGNDKLAGMKFKNIDKKYSKQENLFTKQIAKATEEYASLDVKDDFDKLREASLKAKIDGGDQGLAIIAKDKTRLGNLQDAILETASEFGEFNLKPEKLAKEKLEPNTDPTMISKYGASIEKAQNGVKKFKSEADAIAAGYTKDGKTGKWTKQLPGKKGSSSESKIGEALVEIPIGQHVSNTGLYGKVTPEVFEATKKANPWFNWEGFDPKNPDDVYYFQRAFNQKARSIGSPAHIKEDKKFGEQTASARINEQAAATPGEATQDYAAIEPDVETTPTKEIPYKRSVLGDIYNEVLPYLRKSNKQGLDYNQLSGELYALAHNQVEPVNAQFYQPDLATPYAVSYQDIRNANQADFRSSQRMAGYNPAAQSILNAQKYAANEKTFGQEFRENQGRYDKVYGENRDLLNQAKLTNLNIADTQYGRQSQAKSNTKEATQLALNSISSKFAQKELENTQLGIMENMYNYRYDKDGRAINLNPLFQPNIPTVGSKKGTQKQVPVKDDQGNILYYQLEETGVAKQGAKLSKKGSNGSIVKSIKNL